MIMDRSLRTVRHGAYSPLVLHVSITPITTAFQPLIHSYPFEKVARDATARSPLLTASTTLKY